MLLTGVITVIAMSIVSANFYFAGIDFSKSNAMFSSAFKEEIKEGEPKKVNGFTVATQWKDLPAEIKSHLNENELIEGELLKKIVGIPIFTPPEAGYFAMKIKQNGEIRYISSMFTIDLDKVKIQISNFKILYIFVIAFIAIALFSIVPFLILRNVATPIENLIDWSKQLDNEKLSLPIPSFHYHELDSLAEIIQSSLHSVQESLAREMRFLGYASHELRTPISVTRTNTELLQKMIEKGVPTDKQLIVLNRIERASLTMTDLTETLLWLNRQQDKSLPVNSISLGELTHKLADELNYLLKGKKVEVSLECDETILLLPETLCRIIITNLIRNAFQHTYEGIVTIVQSNNSLLITNENTSASTTKDDLGFGLGLELTERLIKHQQWIYNNVETQHGYYVDVKFQGADLK